MKTALVIGGGPAGLMAAEELSRAGARVTMVEAKPSIGRKFLMAGKSGLNLTTAEAFPDFAAQYSDASEWLNPMLAEFGPADVEKFADDLGQDVFTGTSGRVFPKKMKASPMLRAWLARLTAQNVTFRTKCRWIGWAGEQLEFETPEGTIALTTDVVVFALGGASWARLGSDGVWADIFSQKGIGLSAFGAANSAIQVPWSSFMEPHFGSPLKAVTFKAGDYTSRGEAVLSSNGLEGGGIYSVSRGVREGHELRIDLKPDWSAARVQAAIEKPHGKSSVTNHLRRVLKLSKVELALLNEWDRLSLSDAKILAERIKNLKIEKASIGPIDETISTSGGVMKEALSEDLMLHQMPGIFCAGEMLDWEAPTGGYLLTACFATGRVAGRGAAKYLGLKPTRAPV